MKEVTIEFRSPEEASLIQAIRQLSPEQLKIMIPTLDRMCTTRACSQGHALFNIMEDYERLLRKWKSLGTYY